VYLYIKSKGIYPSHTKKANLAAYMLSKMQNSFSNTKKYFFHLVLTHNWIMQWGCG